MSPSSEERKHDVFRAIVREYLRSADPVGSGTIASRYRFGVSPATIRNDMVELEDEGLIEQPHTSAGRVPTEKGYRFYVEAFVRESELSSREREMLEEAMALMREREEAAARDFARALAALTAETVFMRIGDRITLVSGVGNLLRKPEFRETETLLDVTDTFDKIDAVVDDMRSRVSRNIEVLIGEDNPFGPRLSAVIARYEAPRLGEGMVGILGPTRMDYDANVALARYIHDIFSDSRRLSALWTNP
jgi:heat-inducible transcriptional repressor